MTSTDNTIVYICFVVAAILGLLSFCSAPVHAADDPEATGPDAMVELSNVRCFDAAKLDPEAEGQAVLMAKTQELWLLLHDPHGVRPDVLAFLTMHDGKKYVCMVAEGLPSS